MIQYCGNIENVNDLYLRNCFYWADYHGLKLPVIQINFGDELPKEPSGKFILMVTGNEMHKSADYYYQDSRVFCIVKNYPHIENTSTDPKSVTFEMTTIENAPVFETVPEDVRTLNIPLGLTNKFPIYCLPEKKYKSGFIGQWTKIREQYLERIASFLDYTNSDASQFQFALYTGFGPFVQNNPDDGSLETEVYAANLASYETSLCISGQSPETFRLYESAAAGCCIISTPLPNVWYYKNLPALYILPEMKFEDKLFSLLDDQKTLKSYQTATQAWYHQYASPPAVGKKIAEHLERLK